MLLTSIKLKDIEDLEQIHAILTMDGWFIPKWLQYLKEEVVKNIERNLK
jgi:hypothetical protein